MIDFSLSPETENVRNMIHMLAETTMRPIARDYDQREHEKPTDWLTMMWNASTGLISFGEREKKPTTGERKPSERQLRTTVLIEELSWGDAGLYLSIPNAGLGGAAVMAAGTAEQRERFLARFRGGTAKWGGMVVTEPGCGSDSGGRADHAVRVGGDWLVCGNGIV